MSLRAKVTEVVDILSDDNAFLSAEDVLGRHCSGSMDSVVVEILKKQYGHLCKVAGSVGSPETGTLLGDFEHKKEVGSGAEGCQGPSAPPPRQQPPEECPAGGPVILARAWVAGGRKSAGTFSTNPRSPLSIT